MASNFGLATSFAILAIATGTLHAQYMVSTLVGGGPQVGMLATAPYLDNFNGPSGVAWDSNNRIYFSYASQVIRVNTSGVIDMVFGNGISGYAGDEGPATAPTVEFQLPVALAIDSSNNLYISDSAAARIRRVDAVSGIVTTIAGTGVPGYSGDNGAAIDAQLSNPNGIAVDSSGNLYIADGSRIRKVTVSTGIITTVAGTGVFGFRGDGGPATSALLASPVAVALDGGGNLYIGDTGNYRIRKVGASTGVITTVAGNGSSAVSGDNGAATSAGIGAASAIAVDSAQDIFIAVPGNIRKVGGSSGIISLYAGSEVAPLFGPPVGLPYSGNGGPASQSTFGGGGGLALNPAGDILLADKFDDIVLLINGVTDILEKAAGNGTGGGLNGPAVLAYTYSVTGLATDPAGNVYVGDAIGGAVDEVSSPAGTFTRYAGNGSSGQYSGDNGPATSAGLGNGVESNGSRSIPLAFDPAGNGYMIVTGGVTAATFIRKVSAKTGIITVFAGGGSLAGTAADGEPATSADLSNAKAMVADAANLYVVDGSGDIRAINLSTGIISTIASGTLAGNAIDRDSAGNFYFTSGDAIVKYTAASHTAARIAGVYDDCAGGPCDRTLIGLETGAQLGDDGPAINATLNAPQGVKLNAYDLLIADTGNHRIRYISLAAGFMETAAGNNSSGCGVGPGSEATLAAPSTLASDGAGNFYVADPACNEVFKLNMGLSLHYYVGHLDVANCTTISGWASDQNGLGVPVFVTITDGTTVIATVLANGPRPDVGTALGDNGLHGFSYTLPSNFTGVHDIHVYYGTSTAEMAGSPKAFRCGAIPPNYAGNVDSANCGGISGWVADRNDLNTSITVSLWDGATQIASTTANLSRPDVGAYLGDDGLHGFTLQLPASYQNGVARALQVHYASTAVQVMGSPVTLTCGGTAKPSVVGHVDATTCSGISGWAADRNALNTSITVSLWDGATQIASAAANASRPDVGAYLGDNGLHGFTLQLPAAYQNGAAHTLQVHYASTATQVGGSPATLTCGIAATPNYAGYVDLASCSGITGWAADRNALNTSISVSLWDGTTQIASTAANVPRADVGAYLGDNGLHGYTMQLPPAYLNGARHTLQVHFAGAAAASESLTGSPVTLTCGGSNNYTGNMDVLNCSTISGWAADLDDPNISINVSIYDGANLLATFIAYLNRPDVGNAIGDDGLHGFSILTPESLRDGQPHTITVLPGNSSIPLPGPQSLTCQP